MLVREARSIREVQALASTTCARFGRCRHWPREMERGTLTSHTTPLTIQKPLSHLICTSVMAGGPPPPAPSLKPFVVRAQSTQKRWATNQIQMLGTTNDFDLAKALRAPSSATATPSEPGAWSAAARKASAFVRPTLVELVEIFSLASLPHRRHAEFRRRLQDLHRKILDLHWQLLHQI
jgi:hypothetical protein